MGVPAEEGIKYRIIVTSRKNTGKNSNAHWQKNEWGDCITFIKGNVLQQ